MNTVSHPIKFIRSDQGTEFKNNMFDSFINKYGIQPEFSEPYTPQQNGVAERSNRSVIETALSLLFSSNLASSFWWYAVKYSVFLLNRRACIVRQNIPYKLFYKRAVDISFIKIFGLFY